MNAFTEGLVSIALAIVGLGVVATLVSRNAQTGNVLQSAGKALATGIGAAEAPVLGGGGFQIPAISGMGTSIFGN